MVVGVALVGVLFQPPAGYRTPVIAFRVESSIRNAYGEYFSYEPMREVPSEAQPLLNFKSDPPIYVAVISAAIDAAVIRATYRGEDRELALSIGKPSEALFAADAVTFSFTLQGTTIPPVKPDDPVLNGQATLQKIDSKGEVCPVSGLPLLEKKELAGKQAQRLRTLLTTDRYLHLFDADCFEPGMEFEIGDGDDAVHAVVCLKCYKVRVIRVGPNPVDRFYGLSKLGVKELGALYFEEFGEVGE